MMAYGKVLGPSFVASAISLEQVLLAYMSVAAALTCAFFLRISQLRLEKLARKQARDQALQEAVDMTVGASAANDELLALEAYDRDLQDPKIPPPCTVDK